MKALICFLFLLVTFILQDKIACTDVQVIDPQFLHTYSAQPNQPTWKKLSPYFLPEDHPIKEKLDKLFSSSRAILNLDTLKKAGFISPKVRKYTRLIVTKHPKFPGIIFKLYIDAQRYHKNKPEWHYWLKRVKGAEKIQNYILMNDLGGYFKVPKKWIYALPLHPSPPSEYLCKHFILVEEEMDIYNNEDNEKKWKGDQVTASMLNILFLMLEDLGLQDCAKPDNIPFCKDGKIAFIDTQAHNQWPVLYDKLSPFLSSSMKDYWKKIVKDGKR